MGSTIRVPEVKLSGRWSGNGIKYPRPFRASKVPNAHYTIQHSHVSCCQPVMPPKDLHNFKLCLFNARKWKHLSRLLVEMKVISARVHNGRWCGTKGRLEANTFCPNELPRACEADRKIFSCHERDLNVFWSACWIFSAFNILEVCVSNTFSDTLGMRHQGSCQVHLEVSYKHDDIFLHEHA